MIPGGRRTLVALVLLAAATAGAAPPEAPFVVASRGLASVVVQGAGASELRAGERLKVLRADQPIGEIEVTAPSSSGVSCRVVSQKAPIAEGDRVARVAATKSTAAEAAVATTTTTTPQPQLTATSTTAASSSLPLPTLIREAANGGPPPNTDATPPLAAASLPAPVAPAAATPAPATSQAKPATTLAPAPAPAVVAALAPAAAETKPATASAPRPAAAAATPQPAPQAGPDTTAASAPSAAVASAPTPKPAAATNGTAPAAAPAVASAPTPKPAAATKGTAPAAAARFPVKYRSAANVYLDGGRAQGLAPADRLRIFTRATLVAELEVLYAAEHSASCKVVSETRPVQAGDVAVRLTSSDGMKVLAAATVAPPAAEPTPSSSVAAAKAGGSGRRPAAPWARLRGSVSFGYYRTWDATESNYDFQERTGRVDLSAYDISGQPLSFTLRGRSRQDIRARTLSDRTPKSERVDRLYEVALRYEPPSDGLGIEAGRIGIYRFVGIGYIDGVLARFRPTPLLQVGGFAGRNADVETLGFGGTGRKAGGFLRLAPAGRWATGSYDATLAFVREDADGDVSREYLSLESRFGGGGRWSIFERAELDLNRGWREEVSAKGYQLTNVSLSGNLRVATSAWAYVSYDGRRNYRYYLNRVVPEEVFDDLLHQGLRAGVNLSRAGGFGATAGFGMSLKEPDPRNPELEIANAYSFNGGVRHSGLFGSRFSASVDFSGYSNGYTDGGLVLARFGRRFAGGHLVDLSYGRSAYRVKLNEEDRTTQFFRLMGRGELGRRVYVQGDFEYDSGDDLEGLRGFLEVGILF